MCRKITLFLLFSIAVMAGLVKQSQGQTFYDSQPMDTDFARSRYGSEDKPRFVLRVPRIVPNGLGVSSRSRSLSELQGQDELDLIDIVPLKDSATNLEQDTTYSEEIVSDGLVEEIHEQITYKERKQQQPDQKLPDAVMIIFGLCYPGIVTAVVEQQPSGKTFYELLGLDEDGRPAISWNAPADNIIVGAPNFYGIADQGIETKSIGYPVEEDVLQQSGSQRGDNRMQVPRIGAKPWLFI